MSATLRPALRCARERLEHGLLHLQNVLRALGSSAPLREHVLFSFPCALDAFNDAADIADLASSSDLRDVRCGQCGATPCDCAGYSLPAVSS